MTSLFAPPLCTRLYKLHRTALSRSSLFKTSKMLPPGASAQLLPVHHTQANRYHPTGPGAQLTGCPVIWRPWTLTMSDTQPKKKATGSKQVSDMQGFHHPVRLFMPRSKVQDCLSHLGRKVLASFPVQATLHFYNDDSSSEEDGEDEDETEIEFRVPVKRTT